MLASVRALINRISHRAGVNCGRQLRIDRDRRDAPGAEAGEFLPELSAVARLIDRIVRGDVKDVRVRRMERDRDDCLTVLLATKTEEYQCDGRELSDGSNQ